MKRRDFLKQTSVAAVAMAVAPVALAAEQKPDWVREFEANTWTPQFDPYHRKNGKSLYWTPKPEILKKITAEAEQNRLLLARMRSMI